MSEFGVGAFYVDQLSLHDFKRFYRGGVVEF